MTLRFLDLVPSAAPDYPFLPGQSIQVTRLTAEMRQWVRSGKATVVGDEEPELATVAPGERAVLPKGKRK